MKFELVEFYPWTGKGKGKLRGILGTAHVFITDYGIDLRGIQVIQRKNRLVFYRPFCLGWDKEEDRLVQYPIFAFIKAEDNQALIDFLSLEIPKKFDETGFRKGPNSSSKVEKIK